MENSKKHGGVSKNYSQLHLYNAAQLSIKIYGVINGR